MLKQRLGGALTALFLMVSGSALVAVPPASAANGPGCQAGWCEFEFEQPVVPGGGEQEPAPGPGEGETKPIGNKPPPKQEACIYLDMYITCDGWSRADECYWSLQDPQEEPPAGKNPEDGAWYDCSRPIPDRTAPGRAGSNFTVTSEWRETAPTDVVEMTPGQAAQILVASFQLQGIDPGMVPRYDQGQEGTVGMPVWMWVRNTSDTLAWGPYTRSEQIGGLAMSATARVASVTWHMGDGKTVVCTGPGTPYQEAYGKQPSPDCGYKYTSRGTYQVTAVTNWEVSWTGPGGASGMIPTTTQTTVDVPVGSLQAVNVAP